MSKQAKRARQQAKATERLTSVATPKQIRREARSLTRQAFKPLVRQVKDEKKASRLQQGRISDYFDEYGSELDKAAQTSSAATQTAIDQISGSSKTAADYAEQLREKLVSEDKDSAALRGATYDPSSSQTNVAAQLARIGSANVLSGVTAAQGANSQRYLADKKTIGRREEIEQHLREAARKRSLNKDLREIKQDKGTYKVGKLAELKDRERDFLLSQQAAQFDRRSTRKAQKLDARAQRVDARQTARSQAEARRHNRTAESISAQNAATSAQNANTSRRSANIRARAERRARREDRYERRHPNAGDAPNRDPGEVSKALGILNAADAEAIRTPKIAYEYLVSKGISPGAAKDAIQRAKRRAGGSGGPGPHR